MSPSMHTALKSQEVLLKFSNTLHRPINSKQLAKPNRAELLDMYGKKMGKRNGCLQRGLLNSHSPLILIISDPKIAKGPLK